MKIFNRDSKDLELEDIIFWLISIVAVAFGFLSFFGIAPFTQDQLSSIVIGALGFLMASVVALKTRRKSEIREIRESLGISESKIIESTRELEDHFASSARQAKMFILDTSLNRVNPEKAPKDFFAGIEDGYRRIVYNRTKKMEIRFKRIEIIFHRQNLEWTIFRLLLHEGHNYEIKHYNPPASPIPLLSFISLDGTTFYLGGFHLKGTPTEEKALLIKEPNLSKTLIDYWDAFWSDARSLNSGGIINWEELRQIGMRVGVDKEEFDDMLEKLKLDVARERQKID